MLALDRVSKTYPNGVEALARFSAEIRQGEIIATAAAPFLRWEDAFVRR